MFYGYGFYSQKFRCLPLAFTKRSSSASERTTHAEFGGGLKFELEIIDGKYAGKSVFRTTGDKPTPRNVAGKVLAALAGAKPSDGLAIDADDYIGRSTQSSLARPNLDSRE